MLVHHNCKSELPTRLVVLGGSGFIGKEIVAQSEKRGIATLSISSRDIDFCNIDAGEKLAKILHPTDSVVFCSAIDNGSKGGSEELLKNIQMAKNVEVAAKSSPFAHLIYISSESVYSYEGGIINEKTPANPASLYGLMHRTRELILATKTNVPLAILRLTAVYGDGDTHNAYGPNRFIRQAAQDKKIMLFGNGEEMRDHFHIEDVAELVLQTVCNSSVGVLNLATGNSRSFYKIAQAIAEKTGAKIERLPRNQNITHRHFDITNRLKAFPQFTPKMIDSLPYSSIQTKCNLLNSRELTLKCL